MKKEKMAGVVKTSADGKISWSKLLPLSKAKALAKKIIGGRQ
jgi:hypothetical protein